MSRIDGFFKSISYTASSALLTALVSILSVLIIPRLIGVADYGYWALFLFYGSYVPFLQFGWTDGIYLRYGGSSYPDIDKPLFSSQLWLLSFTQLFIGAIFALYAQYLEDRERQFIVVTVAAYLVLVNTRYFFTYVLQLSARFRDFSLITIADRLIYVVLVGILLATGVDDFRWLILADLVAKSVTLFMAFVICRDIVHARPPGLRRGLVEMARNITAGFQLMVSNTTNMLILGTFRLGIDRAFGVVAFAKMSLALNISNFLMVLVNSLAMVLFPFLRRFESSRWTEMYVFTRTILMPILLGVLVLHQPAVAAVSAWLPDYRESVSYLSHLFPVVVFEGKMALLVVTFFKAIRGESRLLAINMAALALSGMLAYVSTVVLHSLEIAALSILLVLAVRGTVAEISITRSLGVSVTKPLCGELCLVMVFIVSNWFGHGWAPTLLYLWAFVAYLLCQRKQTRDAVKRLSHHLFRR